MISVRSVDLWSNPFRNNLQKWTSRSQLNCQWQWNWEITIVSLTEGRGSIISTDLHGTLAHKHSTHAHTKNVNICSESKANFHFEKVWKLKSYPNIQSSIFRKLNGQRYTDPPCIQRVAINSQRIRSLSVPRMLIITSHSILGWSIHIGTLHLHTFTSHYIVYAIGTV